MTRCGPESLPRKHVLFSLLPIRRAQNESPVLLCLPPGLSRASHERIAQIFFERFNVAGYTNIDRPMAQLYAANALSGVVVDIGSEITDVTPVYDGFICPGACAQTNIGVKDCQLYLANLLGSNQSVSAISNSPSDLLALARQIQDANLIRIPSSGEKALTPEDEGVTDIAAIVVAGREKAVIEQNAQKKKKLTAAEAARAKEIEALDLVTVQFKGQEVTVGRERHRFCEPLFDPMLLQGIGEEKKEVPMALQDAVGFAIGHAEVDQRQYIWGGLFVTGELANHVKGAYVQLFKCFRGLIVVGVGTALQSRCAPYILSSADQANDIQTRFIRPITVPEYFAEYRDKADGLAAFLGSSIVAKVCHLT
jgi:actin-related protein 9